MAEWLQVVIAALALMVTIGGALLKFSSAVAKLTISMDNLNDWLKSQGARIDEHDGRLDDHESRIVEIETTHKIRGCEKAAT